MKRRIIFGLAPIFLLIVGMGVYAISLFAKLGTQVDVVLRENYRSVVAGQIMKEAAERMDSGLFYAMVGEEERGKRMYSDNVPKFLEGMQMELGNITLPGEDLLAKKIETLYQVYSTRADSYWKTSDVQARRDLYFKELLPAFTGIKDSAQAVITLNQENMLAADRNARDLSAKSIRYMALASLIGIGAAIFFAVRLQKAILLPIETLTAVSKELGEGKLDQVVPVSAKDELGELAEAFNKMAAKLRAYRQITGDQILQARQMTETTFSAFPDPIVAITAEGVINFSNPAASNLFAKLDSDGNLPAEIETQVGEVLKGGPDYLPTSFEKAVVLRVDDKEVFLLPRVIGMRDDSGVVHGAAAILQDVTRLRLLDEVKSNLVSTVSHELKTPLTSVRMGLHLLLEERIGALNSKQTELLLAAREDSERLLGMINDLLDLAKLESGKLHLYREPTPAGSLAKTAAADMEAFAESQGTKIHVEVPADLPLVNVDQRQILHVFANLISNAIKHSPRGETVTLFAGRKGHSVRFSVIDHGAGIAPEHHGRIFERFFRVAGDKGNGAGLGLAIAREIVTAHGGTVGLKSKLGEGSEFYFELPEASGEAPS